jgi:superfamily II RNA helicase
MKYRGLELDPFQREAVELIEQGESVIVSAPTGTGKTLIADYLIEQILEDGGEVIYTSPVKALSNQKYRQYTKLFGEDAVGLVTGDLVINRDAPVRIMTTEILRNILLEGRGADEAVADGEVVSSPAEVTLPDLDRLRAVIVDEIHFLADPDRGTVWEELLIYLPRDVRILGLSATLSNLDEFADWLSEVRGAQVHVVHEPTRAVPLRFLMMNNETGLTTVEGFNKDYARSKGKKSRKGRGGGGGSRRRGRKPDRRGGKPDKTRHLEVIESLHDQAFPALYFIFSRALVERLAGDLSRSRVGKQLATRKLADQVQAELDRFEEANPGVLTGKLRGMYRRGVAFHHAGLHVALKGLVEGLYEAGLVRVLYCTSTFALGINMPARTVIFDALSKYDGQQISPLTVREFMQMAGRAGRRGLDVEGDVVIRQDFHDYDAVQGLLRKLLAGESEPVTSSFNLSFHSVVNLLDRFDQEDIRGLLERSFRIYHAREVAAELRVEIERREGLLEAAPEEGAAKNPKAHQRVKRHRRRLSSLRRRLLEEERPRLWEEFQRKLAFLRAHGYIGADDALLAPAKILRHIKVEEVFMTELVLSGALEELTDDELFGVMCGLVQTLPRSARVSRPSSRWREVVDPLFEVYLSDAVQSAGELTDTEPVFTPELMPLGARWAQGASLSELMDEISNPTDLSGDLVGALRRAKDMIGQLRAVYYDDRDRRRELGALIRKVTRDEVEVVG